MKARFFSALLTGIILCSNLIYAETVDTTSDFSSQIELNQTHTVNLTGFDYEFKHDKDSLTLKMFTYGKLSFHWEKLESGEPFVGFRYRSNSNEDWIEAIFESDSQMGVLENIAENKIFELQIGSGSTKNQINYDHKIYHVNSLGSSMFKSNQAKGKEEGVLVTWGIENDLLQEVLSAYPNASFKLKYNTKIGKKRNEADETTGLWTAVDDISINKVSQKVEELVGGENYVYKVGLQVKEKTIWSKENKFKTKRTWGLFKMLVLIGALGMFIFGMKIMSEGLQQAAGSRLRNMLGRITSNRFKGVLTGVGITSVVQSSSVTTVMVVSFVNAGLMTLKQSVGVMMGANIGTTMTAWLILVFGFKVSISSYALILIAFGAPMLFFTKGKIKVWASVIIGFALLFMGLGELKDAVPSLGVDSALVQFFVEYRDAGILGTLMFIGLGTLVTVVIQSSSAAMALTMTMVAGGVLPFEVAAAMILGENIGTTITAQLAALIGNVHAKRAARIHALFNVIGVVWMVIVFQFFLEGIAFFMNADPFTNPDAANVGIAIFHTSFNVANVILLIWFTPKLVTMAERSVRSKGAADEEFHLDYIGTGIMGTPDLSILEAKKEVAKFGAITSRMSTFTQSLLTEQSSKAKGKLYTKIEKYEEITDRVEIEVANYLAQVSKGEMTDNTAHRVRAMNSIVNDLERIGDIFYQISKSIERKEEQKIWFLPEQRESLLEMFKLVDSAFEVMIENLESDWDSVSIDRANEIEETINAKRDEMKQEHLSNLNKKDFNLQSGMIFSNIFSLCEKAGDHIINVSEAVVGEI